MIQQIMAFVMATLAGAYDRLENWAALGAAELHRQTSNIEERLYGEHRAAHGTKMVSQRAARGQLGIFMVLVFGAVALVVVSIVLLFGMDIAGEFAAGIDVDNDYSDQANSTVNSTGDAFELFGTSVLVIPAAAVLAVLIGGLIGAVTMVGGGALPGMGGGMRGGR